MLASWETLLFFDESGSVIHRNIYVKEIAGLNVVQRTPVDVGCGWVKVFALLSSSMEPGSRSSLAPPPGDD